MHIKLKFAVLLLIVSSNLVHGQSHKIKSCSENDAKALSLRADSCINKLYYDSAAILYRAAGECFENLKDWYNCIESFRKSSHNYLVTAVYDSAMLYSDKAYKLAEKYLDKNTDNDLTQLCKVLINYGNVEKSKGKYSECLKHYNEAEKVILETNINDSLLYAEIQNKKGIAYKLLGKSDSALYFCTVAFNISIRHDNDSSLIMENYIQMGNIYSNKSEYDKAIEFYMSALNIINKNEKKQLLSKADIYQGIGNTKYRKGERKEALSYLQEAIDIYQSVFGEEHPKIAAFYRDLSYIYNTQGEFETALQYLQKSLHILLYFFGELHPEVASDYYCMGYVYRDYEKYDLSLEYSEKALRIFNHFYGDTHPDVALACYNISLLYQTIGEYEKASDYMGKALDIYYAVNGENHPNVALCYMGLGVLYGRLGDYDKTQAYLLKALQINKAIYGENHRNVASSYLNLGVVTRRNKDYNKSLEYYQMALKILHSLYGEKHELIIMCINNIGVVYESMGNMNDALKNYETALQMRLEVSGENNTLAALCYENVANILFNKKEYKKALDYYLKTLDIRKLIFGAKHPTVSRCCVNIASLFSSMNEYKMSLKYCQEALTACMAEFNDTSVCVNPELVNIASKRTLFDALVCKAVVLYGSYKNSTQSLADLEMCISTYELAFQLINDMRNDYNLENTKMLLSADTKKYFTDAINAVLEVDSANVSENKKAFEYIEQLKATVLVSSFNEMDAKHVAGIPDSTLIYEKKTKLRLDSYDTEIARELTGNNGYDTAKVNELQDGRFLCMLKYDSLKAYYENVYPDYFNLRYDEKIVSVDSIQNIIGSNTVLIDYFNADSVLYVVVITDKQYHVRKINVDNTFKETVAGYYHSIKTAETESFLQRSHRLFDILISPVSEYIAQKHCLIIIPDDYLYYIPFETLSDSSSDNSSTGFIDPNYLVKSHSITYHHSATLWYNLKNKPQKQSNRKESFVGFAPVFSDKAGNGLIMSENLQALDTTGNEYSYRSVTADLKSFNPLPYSEKEVHSIVNLFEKNRNTAVAYLYSDASESNFKNVISDYKYIHISSHGFSNDQYPKLSGIAFSQPLNNNSDDTSAEDGILYAGEISSLTMPNADLLTLSACESGMGKLIKGEGLMALSRGFLLAGVPNIVYSLWRIPDKATTDLMTNFYKYILDGNSYAESLRLAKLDMISSGKYAFPIYWGGLMLTGK